MTEAQLWALIAFLMLSGWATSLVLFARATLPMANALSVTNKVDALVDDRIVKLYERIEQRRTKGASTVRQPAAKPTDTIPADDAAREIARTFGGMPFSPEQPDAESVEIFS